LLALLAVAGDRGMTRDSLVAQLWPDTDEERGRRALTQALYALRRDLGSEDVLLGLKDLRLNPDLITSDVAAFHAAVDRGDLESAVELYRGPFLEGFNLPGSDTFERWMEEQRGALGHEYQEVLGRIADRCHTAGDPRGAVGWLRRLAALDPLNAQVAVRLMQSLAQCGDLAGALQHARVYEALLRQELDLPPDREVVELAERLRRERPGALPAVGAATVPPLPQPPPVRGPASSPVTPPPAETPRDLAHTSGWAIHRPSQSDTRKARPLDATPSRRVPFRGLLVAGVLLVIGVPLVRMIGGGATTRPDATRVVAVGRIVHYPREGTGSLGQLLADMLATNLARVSGLRVISHVRMVEVLRQVGDHDSAAGGASAARQAGATELIVGALYEMAPEDYRLDLRRVDLATGTVLRAYSSRGADLLAIADSGTSELVRDLGGSAPAVPLADVSTRSLEAYRAYEAGLRKLFVGDRRAAEQLFGDALKADSTFAMAAYYHAASEVFGDRHEAFRRMRRAVTLASRATDRERLLILAAWAYLNSSPRINAYADTLIVRYPDELEGYYYRGQGAINAGDFARAREALTQVVERDSLGYRPELSRCLPCDALQLLTSSYASVDSQAIGNVFIRQWTQRQPFSALAWRTMAIAWAFAGPFRDSSQAAWRRADSLEPGSFANRLQLGYIRFREERYVEAEQIYRVETQAGPIDHQLGARWQLANLLRSMGRRHEALAQVHEYRRSLERSASAAGTQYSRLLEAQLLWENGLARAAVALFDSLAHDTPPGVDPAYIARHRIWSWVHMSGALSSLGDTTGLQRIADSMQALGPVSGLWRDWRLHHHVRGLLAAARRDTAEAARQFALAISSPNFGYTRSNYELAGTYLSLGRPREAVATLQAALRGAVDGGNLYITRTELHERLARAWEAAGRADSAGVHYDLVARHWEHPDPDLIGRRDAARANAARLGRTL
jgi:DNA-binding SARP family transcriptional activator/Tfp pilus assembly protein PilF